MHRSHQIDGSFICIKHLLHVYHISKNKEFSKSYDINELNLDMDKKHHENFHDRLLKLSSNIDKLLKYYFETPCFNSTKEKYKSMLYKKGYYNDNGSVCQYRLHQYFINYHTTEYLLFLKSNVDSNNINSWLKVITTIKELSVHPIRHLLFIEFLFGEIEDL